MTLNYLIVDLEATFSSDESILEDEREIIEIGAVVISPSNLYLGSWNCIVKPIIHSNLSNECIELTGITQAQVDSAPWAFEQIFYDFEEWTGIMRCGTMCSWGTFDRNLLQLECERYGMTYPFMHYRDLSKEFTRKSGKRCTHRRADSINVSRIFTDYLNS